ncbi:MAG: sulfatase-like hydrolase/transferase [Candidatus Limnocylindrales bacterium]
MHPRVVVIIAVVLALLGTLFNLPQRAVEAATKKPDIVLFYLDDNAPYPARLWNDPARTPNLAKFANNGLEFRNAVASTPLCGPARANVLTGQVGHNNGVTQNNIKPFDQRGTISPKLRNKGYKTAFAGKHVNRIKTVYWNRSLMGRLSNDWDSFDIIWENPAKFYRWRQYRKTGNVHFGSAPNDHSSYQAAKRASYIIRNTRKGKPLFLVVSLYDGHAPLTPMKRFEDHPACADIGGWSGPAYDEANVSDKPRWVQKHPRLSEPGYALRDRCESMLTADWVVGQVVKSLVDSGRHYDTLQVLTADNGWLMGDHRLTGKANAYATDVPLYMRWPKVLKNQGRSLREPVSNVDLAPTFCAIARCTIKDADGKSLLPLIKRKKASLDRKYVWIEYLHNQYGYRPNSTKRPAWAGLQTTIRYDQKNMWSYVQYRTGEEELYNLTKDPHRLRNLAAWSGYKARLGDLRKLWRQSWNRDGVRWRSVADQ